MDQEKEDQSFEYLILAQKIKLKVMSEKKISQSEKLEFTIIDVNKKEFYIGSLTNTDLTGQSKLSSIEALYTQVKQFCEDQEKYKDQMQYKKGEKNYQILMNLEALVNGKKRSYKINLTLEKQINYKPAEKDIVNCKQIIFENKIQPFLQKVKDELLQEIQKIYQQFQKVNQINLESHDTKQELERLLLNRENSIDSKNSELQGQIGNIQVRLSQVEQTQADMRIQIKQQSEEKKPQALSNFQFIHQPQNQPPQVKQFQYNIMPNLNQPGQNTFKISTQNQQQQPLNLQKSSSQIQQQQPDQQMDDQRNSQQNMKEIQKQMQEFKDSLQKIIEQEKTFQSRIDQIDKETKERIESYENQLKKITENQRNQDAQQKNFLEFQNKQLDLNNDLQKAQQLLKLQIEKNPKFINDNPSDLKKIQQIGDLKGEQDIDQQENISINQDFQKQSAIQQIQPQISAKQVQIKQEEQIQSKQGQFQQPTNLIQGQFKQLNNQQLIKPFQFQNSINNQTQKEYELQQQKQKELIENLEEDLKRLNDRIEKFENDFKEFKDNHKSQFEEEKGQIQEQQPNFINEVQESCENQKTASLENIEPNEVIQAQQPLKIKKYQIKDFSNIDNNSLMKTQQENYEEIQFQFIISREDAEFCVGILMDGDLENLAIKLKAQFLFFPSCQLIRGEEDPISFSPRPILKNDKVSLKYNKLTALFTVSLNGTDLPPIQIAKEDFNFAFVIKLNEPTQLNDIIEEVKE